MPMRRTAAVGAHTGEECTPAAGTGTSGDSLKNHGDIRQSPLAGHLAGVALEYP
jgi:hypothetical protein